MLALFHPGGWRSGSQLKSSSESWEDAFGRVEFLPEHERIMKNMNLLYECLDARDDYAFQSKVEGRKQFFAGFMSEADVDALDMEREFAMEEHMDAKYLSMIGTDNRISA